MCWMHIAAWHVLPPVSRFSTCVSVHITCRGSLLNTYPCLWGLELGSLELGSYASSRNKITFSETTYPKTPVCEHLACEEDMWTIKTVPLMRVVKGSLWYFKSHVLFSQIQSHLKMWNFTWIHVTWFVFTCGFFLSTAEKSQLHVQFTFSITKMLQSPHERCWIHRFKLATYNQVVLKRFDLNLSKLRINRTFFLQQTTHKQLLFELAVS